VHGFEFGLIRQINHLEKAEPFEENVSIIFNRVEIISKFAVLYKNVLRFAGSKLMTNARYKELQKETVLC